MVNVEAYKSEFIQFLLKTGALKIGSDWTLKSGRMSPYFINIGDFNDGATTSKLGKAYASAILEHIRYTNEISAGSKIDVDLLYGIPEKGVGLAIATAIGMCEQGKDIPWFFTRKITKEHGEASSLSKAEKIKAYVVGRAPKDGNRIAQLDDVFTAGDAKYQARKDLEELGNFELPLLAIAVDRQEIGHDGVSAIDKYEKDTGTSVVSIVNTSEIHAWLKTRDDVDQKAVERIPKYLRVYGTQKAKSELGVDKPLDQRIIDADRSVIVACDVSFERFEEIVKSTADVDGIGGYKIPARSGRKGWERWIETARKHTNKPLIYDGQKLGNDIQDVTPRDMTTELKAAGFDTFILFPHSGPESERGWLYHALDKGLNVIVGGWMTHPTYTKSEGGFITDEGALEIYRIAARAGVTHFVVPGNKLDAIQKINEVIAAEGIDEPTLYSPGFVAQGGKIGDAAKVAGKKYHGIIGRGISESENPHEAAKLYTSQITAK